MTLPCQKPGLSLFDLDSVQTLEKVSKDSSIPAMSYDDQEGIFEVIYQDAEVQDEIHQHHTGRGRTATRRASMGIMSSKPKENEIRRCRRHSSFNPRNRQVHRDAHSHLEEYFLEQGNTQRSSIVSTLLDFHSSFELSMAGSMHDISPALHFSCPVLSYMHDSDEDSVEMNIAKRPSLMLGTYGNEDVELVNYDINNDEDDLVDSDDLRTETEYVIEMSEEEQSVNSHPEKRRRCPSYIALERRLSTESHLAVLKSFISGEKEDSLIEPDHDVTDTEPTTYLDVHTPRTSIHGSNDPVGTSQLSIARMA